MGNAAPAATAERSALLKIETVGAVMTVGLNRPAKRNALNDGIILAIQDCFSDLPEGVGAVVIHGIGDHFSSGLDLSELTEHDATWGYVPGPLEPGIWHVVLGLHRVAATGVSVELTVHAPARRDVEPDPPAPPSRGSPRSGASARRLPSSECLTWWACDFHSHTLHSDGALSVD